MLHLVAPEPCYTEEDVQYKVENMGLDNVDISEQTSAEECRANCRYFQVTILYRSQFIEFPFYRTFEAAKYFTYNTGNSKCRCKPDMDMGAVRQDKTGRISGNVECEKAEPCYTEEDVQYKVENINMTNVDISEQDSAEECRANCRHL